MSEINNEHSHHSISEDETLNKDPIIVQIDKDGKATNELEETKTTDYFMKNEKNNVSKNIICGNTNVLEETNSLKSFTCIICSKIFSSIDLLNIHKYVHPLVKEKSKNIEETCKENCISVKEEDVDIYIKEETSGDYLSDNENIYDKDSYDNIDKIYIEEFKLEEPDI